MVSLYSDENDTTKFTAWPCMLDPETKRPFIGVARINLYSLSYEEKDLMDDMELMMHEMFHALGFTSDNWQYFVNPATGEVRGDSFYRDTSETGIEHFKGPKVLNYAKHQYKCETIKGMKMSADKNHWETSWVGTEIMGLLDVKVSGYISKMTLTFFEDSGWYLPDYSNVSEMYFL